MTEMDNGVYVWYYFTRTAIIVHLADLVNLAFPVPYSASPSFGTSPCISYFLRPIRQEMAEPLVPVHAPSLLIYSRWHHERFRHFPVQQRLQRIVLQFKLLQFIRDKYQSGIPAHLHNFLGLAKPESRGRQVAMRTFPYSSLITFQFKPPSPFYTSQSNRLAH